VITGGPCVGKSSVVGALNEMGFKTIPEVARMVIEEQQRMGGQILPWINRDAFQKEVRNRQLELEEKVDANTTLFGWLPPVFLDRGLEDGVGYYLADGIEVPNDFYATGRNHERYSGIFLLDQLPNYQKDSVRAEDLQSATRIHKSIEKAYVGHGYSKITKVPVMSVKDRVRFILNRVFGELK
jgi:predicted ATPase